MKIMAVLGSPNKEGNTGTLLAQYLKGVQENHEDAEITNLFLQGKEIQGCQGCYACKTDKVDNCAIQDDMHEYYAKIENADVIVLASPIYVFNMTALMKAFLERLFAFDAEKLKGKKLVYLSTYGAPDDVSSGNIHVKNFFKAMSEYIGLDFIQMYGVSAGELPVAKNDHALKEVYDLGKKL